LISLSKIAFSKHCSEENSSLLSLIFFFIFGGLFEFNVHESDLKNVNKCLTLEKLAIGKKINLVDRANNSTEHPRNETTFLSKEFQLSSGDTISLYGTFLVLSCGSIPKSVKT